MITDFPSVLNKCKGALLCTAVGDALGWPYERPNKTKITSTPITGNSFIAWERQCSIPEFHIESIRPGEYSDDTQMTIAVGRSLLNSDWEKQFAENELPYWLHYERGGGRALLYAAQFWSKNHKAIWLTNNPQKYFDAGGNGVVMRILPHVIVCNGKDNLLSLIKDVIHNAIITHGHPRAILGALCYAYTLHYLLQKKDVLNYGELVDILLKGMNVWACPAPNMFPNSWIEAASACKPEYRKTWENCVTSMHCQLEYIQQELGQGLLADDNKILNHIGCYSKNISGAGDVAILAAIYLVTRYGNNPVKAIRVAANMKGIDTDTIASITGGLIGMTYGVDWIPVEWYQVQDAKGLQEMADCLLANDRLSAAKRLIDSHLKEKYDWEQTSIGYLRKIEQKVVPNKNNRIIIIKKLITTTDNTFYIKQFATSPKKVTWEKTDSFSNEDIKSVDEAIVLSKKSLSILLSNQKIMGRITAVKLLNVCYDLLEHREPDEKIAHKYNVTLELINKLKSLMQN